MGPARSGPCEARVAPPATASQINAEGAAVVGVITPKTLPEAPTVVAPGPRFDSEVGLIRETAVTALKGITSRGRLFRHLPKPLAAFLVADAPSKPFAASGKAAVSLTGRGPIIAPRNAPTSPQNGVVKGPCPGPSLQAREALRDGPVAAMGEDARVSLVPTGAHGRAPSFRPTMAERRGVVIAWVCASPPMARPGGPVGAGCDLIKEAAAPPATPMGLGPRAASTPRLPGPGVAAAARPCVGALARSPTAAPAVWAPIGANGVPT